MPITKQELERRFNYHVPSAAAANELGQMRAKCLELGEHILLHVPDGRYQSLALTHLEEMMYWANAGIARPKGV